MCATSQTPLDPHRLHEAGFRCLEDGFQKGGLRRGMAEAGFKKVSQADYNLAAFCGAFLAGVACAQTMRPWRLRQRPDISASS